MKPLYRSALAGLIVLSLPALAEAAQAFATANVNLRAGPSTGYPAVNVVPAGSPVEIYGCLSTANWCDVRYQGYRGWMSGSYIQTVYSSRRVYLEPDYYQPLGIPIVTFSLGDYWDHHYRGRDFYRERDRWRRAPPPMPVWHRGDMPPGPPPGPPPGMPPGPGPDRWMHPGRDHGPDRRGPDWRGGPDRHRPDMHRQDMHGPGPGRPPMPPDAGHRPPPGAGHVPPPGDHRGPPRCGPNDCPPPQK
nr:SH3 domain-containing protein [Allorhizobium sonneratiae]